MKNNILKKYRYALLFLFTFIFQFILISGMKIPYITDEYGTIANSAFLSKIYNWSDAYSSSLSSYWGYGISLLYVPVFWLFGWTGNMVLIYKLLLLVNAVLISFIPIIAYKILTMFEMKDSFYKYVICIISGIFPANMILSKCTWNETMLIFLTWLILFVCLNLFADKAKKIYSAVLPVLLVYAYASSGRGIVIVIATLCTILFISIFTRKNYIFFPLFILTGFVFCVLHNKIYSSILTNLVQPVGTVRNTPSNFILSRNIFSLLNGDSLKALIKGFLGLFYYDYIASIGIITIFIYIFLRMVILNINPFLKGLGKKYSNSEKLYIVSVFYAGLLFIGSILLCTYSFSTIFIPNNARRREYFVYGRYTESCLSLLICLSLYLLPKIVDFLWCKICIWACTFIMVYFSIWYLTPMMITHENKTLSYTMCSGLIPFTGIEILEKTVDYELISAIVIVAAILFLIYTLYRHNCIKISTVMLAIIFVYSSVFSMYKFLWPSSKGVYNNTIEVTKTFETSYGNLSNKIYLLDCYQRILGLQYMLPNFDIVYLNKTQNGYRLLDQITYNSFIMSLEDEQFDKYIENVYYCGTIAWYHLFYYGDNNINGENLFEKRDRSLNCGVDGTWTLLDGKAEICINNCDVNARYSVITNVGEVGFKQKNDKGKTYLIIDEDFSLYNLSVCCDSNVIDSNQITIRPIMEYYEKFEDVNTLFETPRVIYSVTDANTRDNFSYNSNCMKTQTLIYINMNGEVQIANIPIIRGTYKIEIYGYQVETFNVEVECDNMKTNATVYLDNNGTPYIEISSREADYINIILSNKNENVIMQPYVEAIILLRTQ